MTEKEAFGSAIYPSVSDVLPEKADGNKLSEAKMLKNETYCFKTSFSFSGDGTKTVLPVYFRIESGLPEEFINVYKIGNVPIINPVANNIDPSHFISDAPSLYPDPLFLLTKSSVIEYDSYRGRYYEEGQRYTLNAGKYTQALFVEINPENKELTPGEYDVCCVFYSLTDGSELSRETLKLSVLEKSADDVPFVCVNWFYCDSLADVYGVDVFSDRHFELIGNYIGTAVENGCNTVLTPCFTPPLDTRIGKERKTVQLVGVKLENGKYTFDFSLFERFVRLCLDKGVEYFEHSHLFTQWGAEHCPKIVADVGGKEKRVFGWETDSADESYAKFLKAYFAALLPELDKLGIRDRTFFHVSDEPKREHLERYMYCSNLLKSLAPDIKTADAMSCYEFYESGSVDVPVVREISPDMDKFTEGCGRFWMYYTGGKIFDGHTNRLITLPQARNYLLGLHLYVAGTSGFLHWGYNYYYDALTHGTFDPALEPCFYFLSPGTSYLVYPSPDGKAIPSLRIKVMKEAIRDYKLFKTLENRIGRKKVLELIESVAGKVRVDTLVKENELISLRNSALSLLTGE